MKNKIKNLFAVGFALSFFSIVLADPTPIKGYAWFYQYCNGAQCRSFCPQDNDCLDSSTDARILKSQKFCEETLHGSFRKNFNYSGQLMMLICDDPNSPAETNGVYQYKKGSCESHQ